MFLLKAALLSDEKKKLDTIFIGQGKVRILYMVDSVHSLPLLLALIQLKMIKRKLIKSSKNTYLFAFCKIISKIRKLFYSMDQSSVAEILQKGHLHFLVLGNIS